MQFDLSALLNSSNIPLAPSSLNRHSDSGVSKGGLVDRRVDSQAAGRVSKASTDETGLALTPTKSPGQVADSMLSFVGAGLQALQQQGAGSERLLERLAAAGEGIAAGYEQAEQQLSDMGLLNEELKAQIDAGRELIEQGLAEMAHQLGVFFEGNEQAVAPAGELTGESQPSSSITTSASELNQTAHLNSPLQLSAYGFMEQRSHIRVSPLNHSGSQGDMIRHQSQQSSLSMQIRTRDGDEVTIDFSRRSSAENTDGGGREFGFFDNSSAWQLEVTGELDDNERAALSNLLNDVEKLSQNFFNSDYSSAAMNDALEQAMSLGFDRHELASMSLNLQQSTLSSSSVRGAEAYQAAQPSMPTESLNQLTGSLKAYQEGYLEALEQAKNFSEPEALLEQLIDEVLPQNAGAGFKALNQGLLESMSKRVAG